MTEEAEEPRESSARANSAGALDKESVYATTLGREIGRPKKKPGINKS